jgi:hypothetical protein
MVDKRKNVQCAYSVDYLNVPQMISGRLLTVRRVSIYYAPPVARFSRILVDTQPEETWRGAAQ